MTIQRVTLNLPFKSLEISDWQANPATGTAALFPERINDGLWSGQSCLFDAIGQYAEVIFNHPMYITQYRIFGHSSQNADGLYTIYYLWDGNWIEITTEPTRRTTWSHWKTFNFKILTKGVRLTTTIIDSNGGNNLCGEFQVKE